MEDVIITCDCGDTEAFAKDAYHLLFPGESLPPIRQINAISDQEMGAYPPAFKSLRHTELKFAFCSHQGEIWDLRKGVRVA